jgi:hypothetical protein
MGSTYRRRAARLVAVVATLAAAGACSSAEPASDDSAPLSAPPPAGARLFADDFDDDSNGWALPENEVLRTEMESGDMVWRVKAVGDVRPHLLARPLGDAFEAGTLRMRDVVVSAGVTPVAGLGALGLFCRESRGVHTDFQWYEFVVRDGYAAIRRSNSAGELTVLATTKDASLPLGDPATVQATCADDDAGVAQLWLGLDGTVLLHAEDDDPLGNGVPGLQAYDSPDEDPAARLLVRWHDFTVHRAIS